MQPTSFRMAGSSEQIAEFWRLIRDETRVNPSRSGQHPQDHKNPGHHCQRGIQSREG